MGGILKSCGLYCVRLHHIQFSSVCKMPTSILTGLSLLFSPHSVLSGGPVRNGRWPVLILLYQNRLWKLQFLAYCEGADVDAWCAMRSGPSRHNFSDYFSGALGRRSITYFPLATEINGTPGTFRIRCLSALSLVATFLRVSFVATRSPFRDLRCILDVSGRAL
jgi:hypothetical protein